MAKGKGKAPQKGLRGQKPKTEKLNPFERKVQKKKHQVLGRKLKGQEQRVGQSRSQAVEGRKKTLLVEYQQHGKANNFVDKRFGASDANLTEEEKMLVRFQKERARQLKKERFNLEDRRDEDDFELTHLGAPLSNLKDDFEEEIEHSESDEEINSDIVKEMHFGGFMQQKKRGRGRR